MPQQLRGVSPGKGRKKRRDDDDYYGGREKPHMKPPDQEKLTDAELKEEYVKSLTTYDPVKPRNLAVWDTKESSFISYVDPESCVFMFSMESELISKEGPSLKQLGIDEDDLIEDVSDKEVEEGFERPVVVNTEGRKKMPGLPTADGKGDEVKEAVAPTETAEEDEGDEGGDPGAAPKSKNKLLNQFNFCERASQTSNNRPRTHGAQTEPPPQGIYRETCALWAIYDAYMLDLKNKPKATKPGQGIDFSAAAAAAGGQEGQNEEGGEKKLLIKEIKKEKEVRLAEKPKIKMRKESAIEGQAATDKAYRKSAETLRYLERIVAVNNFDDVLYDFKYFDDNSDGYRDEGEGTVLPLWRFLYDKAKKKHVTCISWSEKQPDAFAVSYGSFSFIHPVATGLVVLYSIRNPLFPEHIWQGDKGAMSCHISPTRNCLVCIGLSDGNVVALNLEKDTENESQSEVYENYPLVLKHQAPVWSVKWGPDDLDENPTFFSASMDGKVMRWTLGIPDADGNGGLDGAEITIMTLPQKAVDGPDGTSYQMFGCARCIVFHPTELTVLLVGTAEGKIFLASSLYGDKFLKVYDAHFLGVAAIQWNNYHQNVFISCSEDWTVKVWERDDPKPMFVFETGVPIMDVCWAPYSSSVFGCVTLEGKILVYDLNVNREKPICTQQVATKKKIHPHRMQFNPVHPIVVIGDDRGSVLSVKLSPNLRIMPKDTRGIFLEGDVRVKWEYNKLVRILKYVRDPQIVTNPKPTELPLLTNLAEIPGQLSQAEPAYAV